MVNEEKKYELIKFNDGEFSLDVNVSPSEETVWLTQEEMAMLFEVDRSRIVRHINNIYKDNELDYNPTCAENAQVQKEGNRMIKRIIKRYNLDMIIAVGYRVNSRRGTLFRKWANQVLKQYLLNGYIINDNRIMAYQSNILQLEASVINIEKRLKNLEETIYSTNNQIIFEGEIIEPYSFLMKLFFLAHTRIIIIDNYADDFLLKMLEPINVSITIYTNSKYLKEIKKENIHIITTDVFHDRFIIIDEITYSLGTSINSIGKKRFVISKLEDIDINLLLKKQKNW